jgi:hypothetical protein
MMTATPYDPGFGPHTRTLLAAARHLADFLAELPVPDHATPGDFLQLAIMTLGEAIEGRSWDTAATALVLLQDAEMRTRATG